MRLKHKITRNIFVLFLTLALIGVNTPCMVSADRAEALETAKTYLEAMPFSRDGLVEQLVYAGYTQEESEFAADNAGVDWNEMAVLSAESYLLSSDYSENGLIRQLESSSEKFTHDQAVYGVSIAGKDIDWNEMAARRAAFYLRSSAFSENGLIKQLESDRVGFTHEQAVYGAEKAGQDIDWVQMAIKRAENLLDSSAISANALIRQLESDAIGFTHEQAEEAVAVVGENVDWYAMAAEKAASYLRVMSVSRSELIQHLESDAEGFTHEEAVYGADNSGASWGDMIQVLAENLDNLFPIHGIEDTFTNFEMPLYSDIGSGTAIETSTQYGTKNIILFTNNDSIHDRSDVIRLNSGHLQNFMLSIDVTINDVFPSNQAGCFIGYTNDIAASQMLEEGTQVFLIADGEGVGLYRKTNTEDSGTFTRIQNSVRNIFTLTIIRFLGQTYAFIDGVFAGQQTDTNAGPFQLVYGVITMKDGETANCSFDNLSVRKVSAQ